LRTSASRRAIATTKREPPGRPSRRPARPSPGSSGSAMGSKRSLRSARELANERVTKGHRHNQTKMARAPFETPGSSLTGLLRERCGKHSVPEERSRACERARHEGPPPQPNENRPGALRDARLVPHRAPQGALPERHLAHRAPQGAVSKVTGQMTSSVSERGRRIGAVKPFMMPARRKARSSV